MSYTALPQLIEVEPLVPYANNSRLHSREQIEQLKDSFRKFGFVGILAFDAAGLAIGHARREALLEMWQAGETVWGPGKREPLPAGQAPGLDITGLSDDERRALIIADNKLALNADWDSDTLRAELALLSEAGFDMSSIGFDPAELDQILNPSDAPQGGPGKLGALTGEFLVAPLTVLNAREGWWQDRKRGWLALGIQSEIGRGDNLLKLSDTLLEPDPEKRGKARGSLWGAGMGGNAGQGGQLGKYHSSSPQSVRGGGSAKGATGVTTPAGLAFGQMAATPGHIKGDLPASGTSIFDPVLCELLYRWFAPQGGLVLDPFAGGSVRGIVAAALGRRYVGIDLRQEQVDANRAQWPDVAAQLAAPRPTGPEVPPLRVEECDGIQVVRDDDVMGGTKRRALDRLLGKIEAEEFVYASPAYGFAQIALAYAARAAGKRATIVVAARKERHPRTQLAALAGASIIEVPAGRLNVINARAREHCEQTGAYLIPFGMDDEMFVDAIAEVARELDAPAEVWCVAGSGTLTRALQRAWPDAKHHAVQIGRDPDVGNAQLWKAPEKFEEDATDPPPFPSCSNYDAKAWRFIREHASPGALFWNLGADPEPAQPFEPAAAPEWLCGDSSDLLPLDKDDAELADFVFSCPPYGDLEVYSDIAADLSTMKLAEFLVAYRRIIQRAVDSLKPDRFACFVVGDYRDAKGFYSNFVSETIAAFEAAGARFYNEAILVTAVGSLAIRAGKSFRTTRKLGKTHQQILVFCKGDPRKATEACGAVDVSAALAQLEGVPSASAE